MLKILIADDHPLFREGLARLVGELDSDVETKEAEDFTNAVALARSEGPFNLILTDLRMPGMDQFEGVRALRDAAPSVPIVIVSGYESRANLERSLEAGAQGFLPKSAPASVMVNALRLVLLGEIYVPPSLFSSDARPTEAAAASIESARTAMEVRANIEMLTQRQMGVLALIGQGLSNRDIAQRLRISEGTVKVHVGAILKTLGVSNRTQAALLATDLGITLNDDDPDDAMATGT
jgi:DNA-binding NarL/FixJ family response regulator